MEIRTYSKKELAIAYAPNISMVAALNRLALWLKTNHQLWDELLQTGYRTTQRYFNSRQVRLIFDHLGEP